jgi:leucyl aminopeptidase
MRAAISAFLIAVTACAGPEPARGPDPAEEQHAGRHAGRHYVSIGLDALETARGVLAAAGEQLAVLDVGGDAAVLEVGDAELEELSERMHEQHARCGGFMVHESLAEARAALQEPADGRPIEYTLDQAAVVQAVLPQLGEARILATIEELSAMQNRYYQSDSGAAASRWLRDRWRSFSAREDVTVELFDHGYAQQSVILTIPGTTRAHEVVVLGGHLDSISFAGRDRKESRAPGADDDASGIATLTEVARVLLAGEYRPARTVQMIAYAAEEVGLRGSLGIVREYRRRGVNVVGVLQLDMTNYQGSDRDIWVIQDHTSAAQNEFLIRLIDAYVGATWGLAVCGYACSDHASWNRAGIPASMPFESRSDQRNRKIHTAKDTLETSGNNAAHAVKFARLAAAYAIELAKTAPGSPRPAAAAEAPSSAACTSTGSDGRALAAAFGLLLALGLCRALAGYVAHAAEPGRR